MKHGTALLFNLTICFLLIMACSPLPMLATPTAAPTQTASFTPTLAPTSTKTLTPPPPTDTPVPTSARPTAPKDLKVTYDCQWKRRNLVQITFYLTWNDVSDNETGFDIYKNKTFVKQLPANATRYVDAVVVGVGSPSGGGSIYEVQAFNPVGKSNRASISMRYQC